MIRFAALPLFAFAMTAANSSPSDDYRREIDEWRKASEVRLKSDTGWLTVSGLFWLEEGRNTFGSAASNRIVLPASAPAQAGYFTRTGRTIGVTLNPGVKATLRGKPFTGTDSRLQSDENGAASGKEDLLILGDLTMFVLDRGRKIGIRMRDKNSQYRREFTHRNWFPVKPEYRFEAKWVAQPARAVKILNMVNEYEDYQANGYALFRINGVEHKLEPVLSGNQLFFIFKDKTAGKQTYGAGRFLYADLPKDGKVILDFNKAYNPPCVFTPYATCPLPPKQNQLPVAIEAGELNYGGH